jgi:hypothetical protein
MDDLSQTNRPVTQRELALAFGVDPKWLGRLLAQRGINAACRIGGVRVYGPKQIRQVFAAIESSVAATS